MAWRTIGWILIVGSVAAALVLQALTGDFVRVHHGEEVVLGEEQTRAGWYRATSRRIDYTFNWFYAGPLVGCALIGVYCAFLRRVNA